MDQKELTAREAHIARLNRKRARMRELRAQYAGQIAAGFASRDSAMLGPDAYSFNEVAGVAVDLATLVAWGVATKEEESENNG